MGKKMKYTLSALNNQVTLIIIITLFFSVVGSTYAYFALRLDDDSTIQGTAATVDLTLTVNKVFPTKTNSGVVVPQKSGNPLEQALKKGCVDDNSNIICQVYEINITNSGGEATEVVDGKVSFYGDNAMNTDSFATLPNLKWQLITSADSTTPTNSVLGSNSKNIANSTQTSFATNVTLTSNKSYKYYMIVWIEELNEDQSDEGNSYYGKIEFNSSNGTGVTSTF